MREGTWAPNLGWLPAADGALGDSPYSGIPTHCRAVYGLTIAMVCSWPGLEPALPSPLLDQRGMKERRELHPSTHGELLFP